MKVCIKKDEETQEFEFNPSLLQQDWMTTEKALEMGYTIVEAPADCSADDFVEMQFSQEKYDERKANELDAFDKAIRITQIEKRLEQLSQDFIQAQVGAEFDDLEERKEEFRTLHNELRELLGKEPRTYN